ncbi:MAG: putative Heme oxygenase [Myxococcales bacterium]|nr:putative Heme oxygenase [Myxococcales bacterium]
MLPWTGSARVRRPAGAPAHRTLEGVARDLARIRERVDHVEDLLRLGLVIGLESRLPVAGTGCGQLARRDPRARGWRSSPKGLAGLPRGTRGTRRALGPLIVRVLERLCTETRELQAEADSDLRALLAAPSPDGYRTFLSRLFGFVRPLEGSLWETTHLARFLDLRRLRRHPLLAADLEHLGATRAEVEALPRCTSIPWFETVPEALGWAFVLERSTLFFPSAVTTLGCALPDEIRIAGSYLTSYNDPGGEMWGAFLDAIDVAVEEPHHVNRIVDATKAGFRHLRRWRATLDGKPTVSEPFVTRAQP